MSKESLTASVELALVGGVLERGASELARVRTLVDMQEWGDPRARAVMIGACELVDRGEVLTIVALAAVLDTQGTLAALGGLEGLDRIRQRDRGEAEREVLAKRVRDHARVRATHTAVVSLAKAGSQPDAIENPDGYIASVSTLADASRLTLRRGSMTSAETARRTIDAFVARGKRSPAIPTPIEALNRLLGGGWWPKRNYILGARPGVGKTAFAVDSMIHGAKLGHPQFMFSREMPPEDLGGRSIVILANIDAKRWERGPTAFTESEGKSIVAAASRFAQLPIEIDYDESEVGSMLARLRVWLDVVVKPMQEANPGVIPMVWVDYLQECKKAGKFQNRDVMLGEVMSGFANFGRDFGVATGIVAACNRLSAKENRPPRMHDLRECGSAEFHANTVMLFHRDSGAILDEEGAPRGELVEQDGLILVDKNRGGVPGVVKSLWRGNRGRWCDRPDEVGDRYGAYAEH